MKSLDEVIRDLGVVDGTPHMRAILIDTETWENALQYLKEYRTLQTAYIKAMADIEDNPPLTWDELRRMEGKPVWVEYGIGFNQKRWVVIHSFHNSGFCYMNVSGNYPNTFWQKVMGKDEFWQAYRKERT